MAKGNPSRCCAVGCRDNFIGKAGFAQTGSLSDDAVTQLDVSGQLSRRGYHKSNLGERSYAVKVLVSHPVNLGKPKGDEQQVKAVASPCKQYYLS